ncbi:hypothetical protein [Taibaiella soli]|uniref:hypothetical protein n=1 Tax=Taibaiella soli TaxID=1649169 RepID=UPI000F50AB3F|nr:hypothetical protein [Taibaiella soli]
MKSKDSLYFRYYTNCNVVDVWSKDGVSFYGMATTYTYEPYNKKRKIRKSRKYHFVKMALDSATAALVYNLSCGIASIPTGDSIKDDKIGSVDGSYRIFVSSTPFCICQKRYWSGSEQQNLLVTPTTDAIDSVLNLTQRRDRFIAHLKPWHFYYRDEMTVISFHL